MFRILTALWTAPLLLPSQPAMAVDVPAGQIDYAENAPRGPAGGLLLRELTMPRSLFVWSVLRETERRDTAYLRKLALDVWLARATGVPLAAEPILTEALADRNPVQLVTDALAFAEGGTGGVAADREAARLWSWFASSPEGKLLPLPKDLTGRKGHEVFVLTAAAEASVPIDRLTGLLAALVPPGTSHRIQTMAFNRMLWSMLRQHEFRAVHRSVRRLRNKNLKDAASSMLFKIRRDHPGRAQAADKPVPLPENAELRRLLSLDTSPDNSTRIPFPLLREVLKLEPDKSLALARQLKQPQGHWLGWMLFMRAAEGDPAAATEVAVETGLPLVRAGETTATVWALRPDVEPDAFLTEVKAMTSPAAAAEALAGFLTGKRGQEYIAGQLGNPVFGFATSLPLPASFWRAGLCKAAAAGAGEAALATAESLKSESRAGRDSLKEDIVRAWALTHEEQVRSKVAQLTNPDELVPFRKALESVSVLPVPPP